MEGFTALFKSMHGEISHAPQEPKKENPPHHVDSTQAGLPHTETRPLVARTQFVY